jgi:undecaprenyl-diphosphatase
MHELDIALTAFINHGAGQNPALDFMMIWITTLGVPVMVLAVAAQWWMKSDLDVSKSVRRHVLVSAGFAFLIGLAVNQLILLTFHRIRPYDAGITRLIIEKSADPSFPSDHATAAVAIAAVFLLAGWRKQGFAFCLAALLIVVSRVFIGTHYMSDVSGGAIIGILAALAVKALYRSDSKLNVMLTSIL